ncbi:hypothetical protein BDZ89DRAFT_300471 [Hymenopellis radicata]|nr:hypothetical protein BDZ89DRAFT_300471 [Hymenopellis radicata]
MMSQDCPHLDLPPPCLNIHNVCTHPPLHLQLHPICWRLYLPTLKNLFLSLTCGLFGPTQPAALLLVKPPLHQHSSFFNDDPVRNAAHFSADAARQLSDSGRRPTKPKSIDRRSSGSSRASAVSSNSTKRRT